HEATDRYDRHAPSTSGLHSSHVAAATLAKGEGAFSVGYGILEQHCVSDRVQLKVLSQVTNVPRQGFEGDDGAPRANQSRRQERIEANMSADVIDDSSCGDHPLKRELLTVFVQSKPAHVVARTHNPPRPA